MLTLKGDIARLYNEKIASMICIKRKCGREEPGC